MKTLLQKKYIWISIGALILSSPLLFFALKTVFRVEGTTIRFLERTYQSDLTYLLSTTFFIIALSAVITSMLFLFLSLSYFAIVSMTSKNRSSGGSFIGLFFITIFSGGFTSLAIYNSGQILEKMLNVKNLYHEIIISKDSNLLFYHDIKGTIFNQPIEQLAGISATCSRIDDVEDNSLRKKHSNNLQLVYSFEFLFRFRHKDIVESFVEKTGSTNSSYNLYKAITPLVDYLKHTVPVQLTRCPSIEEYEPGFIRNRPMRGSVLYRFELPK